MFILETIFVLITPVTILVLVFLEMILVLVTLETNLETNMTLDTNPSTYVDSRNGLCVEVDFQRDDEALLGVRKDDVTFLDVQTVSLFLFSVRAQVSA